MKITTLIEDSREGKSTLVSEFGLSMHIETGSGIQILLDTGTSGRFTENAGKLGIDLDAIDAAVLSHAHYDHGGGLAALFAKTSEVTVYMHENARKEYYGNIGAKLPRTLNNLVHPLVKHSQLLSRYIGLDPDVLNTYDSRIRYLAATKEIFENVFVITPIEHNQPGPEGNKFLLEKKADGLVPDAFDHEVLLAVREESGIVLFTGCCHNGLINMVDTAKTLFPDDAIAAIVGGFHLKYQPMKEDISGTKEDIYAIADYLTACNVGAVYTGHCTGSVAYLHLKERLNDRISPIYTGSVIHV